MNSGFAAHLDIDPAHMEPHNQVSFAAGRALDSLTFAHALANLQRQSRGILARFDDEFDLLLSPTMAIEPPRGRSARRRSMPNPTSRRWRSCRWPPSPPCSTSPGSPPSACPLHVAASGLPVGVQLVAGAFRDAQLIRVASQLEDADPWSERYPTYS